MIKTKKIVATVIITVSIFTAINPKIASAEMWGTNIGSALMKEVLEEVLVVLRATILQTLKKEGAKTTLESVVKTVAGSSDQSMVISSYEDFIFGSAQVAAEDKLVDFFSVIQSGASTSERDMLRNVEQSISSQISPGQPEVTLHEVVNSDDPIGDVFDQTKGGGIGALLSYQFGDYNNSTNAYINSKETIDAEMEQVESAQQTKAIAGSGFDTIVDGNKVVPGKISQEIVSTAATMPMEMINNATNLEEVIASFVVSSTTSFLKKGISVVSKPINNEARKIQRNIGSNGVKVLQDKIKKGLTI